MDTFRSHSGHTPHHPWWVTIFSHFHLTVSYGFFLLVSLIGHIVVVLNARGGGVTKTVYAGFWIRPAIIGDRDKARGLLAELSSELGVIDAKSESMVIQK